MSEPALLESWTGTTCRLRLNLAQRGNALSRELVRLLDEAIERCEARQADLLIIEGAGRHFCTGFDLSGIDSETDDSLLARFTRIELMLQRLACLPFCTVAVAQGRVMGAGADLFAACKVRLVQGDASFAFPGARGFGLVLGSRRLARLVGQPPATGWIATGRSIPLDEAIAAGLVCERLPDAGAVAAAIDAAAASPADAMLLRQLHDAMEGTAAQDDARDLDLLVRSAARPGLQHRVASYLRRVAAARA